MGNRVGLVGFGRIGRNLFRILYKREDVEIGAIADLADPASLEYLLRFDTVLGRFPDLVSIKEGNLYAAGRRIPILTGPEADKVQWRDHGVHTVLEATARPARAGSSAISRRALTVISLAPPATAWTRSRHGSQ